MHVVRRPVTQRDQEETTREGEELVLSLDTCQATDVQATAIIEPGAVRISLTGDDVEDGNLCGDLVRVLLPLGARSLPLLDPAGNPSRSDERTPASWRRVAPSASRLVAIAA